MKHRLMAAARPDALQRGAAALALATACCSPAAVAAPLMSHAAGASAASAPSTSTAAITDLTPWRSRAAVLVRGASLGGPLALVTFDARTRQVTGRWPVGLACERLHLGADTVACLRYNKALSGASQLDVHGLALGRPHESPIQSNALISRTRVSLDGRFVGTTVFVSGHSYAVPGQFSTMTHIWDTRQRKMALDLEKATLTHEGQVLPYSRQSQLNYWGVTFDPRDSDRFYVTVSIRGRPHLARGSVGRGTVETMRPDVECPSISPDGTRIAFKKRRRDQRGWDPAVLDLAKGTETVYPAARGVDDQIEWLDNDTVLYEATQTKMGGAKVDLVLRDVRQPQSAERVWVEDAASPAVLRSPAGS